MGIYLRGKSWNYDFIYLGTRYTGSIGPVSRTFAKEELARIKAAVIEGRLNPARGRKSPLFEDFAEEFLKHKQSVLRPTSAIRTENALKPLKEKFGLKRLDDISIFEIEKYRRNRKEANKANATINRELQTLRHLFNKAITRGKAKQNPMRAVKLNKEENARVRFLSEDEEEKLLNTCGESLRHVVVVALNTGFRRRELLSLRWADVDFVRGIVTVQAAYAKTGERRSIPMNSRVLKTFQKLRAKAGDSSHIFLNSQGTPHSHQVSRTFEGTVERAEIENFHFHDLRHTFASRLVMAGVDLRSVQVLMGHKTIGMTLRYAHLAPEHLKKAVEALDQEKSPINFHNTPFLQKKAEQAKLLISQARRSGGIGRRAGLKIQ